MNKRILELAEQAGLSYVLTPDKPFIVEDLQKFAELILQECSDKLLFRAEQYSKVSGQSAKVVDYRTAAGVVLTVLSNQHE